MVDPLGLNVQFSLGREAFLAIRLYAVGWSFDLNHLTRESFYCSPPSSKLTHAIIIHRRRHGRRKKKNKEKKIKK